MTDCREACQLCGLMPTASHHVRPETKSQEVTKGHERSRQAHTPALLNRLKLMTHVTEKLRHSTLQNH